MFRCIQRTVPLTNRISVRLQHTLPALPYEYNALEPVISSEIMQLHHSKHHGTYVNNLNAAIGKFNEAKEKNDVVGMVNAGHAIKFNGGGHVNHTIFWQNLSPKGGGEPKDADLAEYIRRDFGSFDRFKEQMTAAAVGIQGSGWGWLGYDTFSKRLAIATCPNQDPLQGTTGLIPLLGIDVWEHAYYLQYKNVRPDYVKAIWKIVNWNDVTSRFQKARGM